MIFRKPPKWQKSSSPLEQFARVLMLVAVFALVAWGFYANNQRRMEVIKAKEQKEQSVSRSAPADYAALIQDDTRNLTPAQKAELQNFLRYFHESRGVLIKTHVYQHGPLPAANPDANTISVQLCPSEGLARLDAGVTVRLALGEELMNELANKHFPPYFAQGRWPDGLAAAFKKMEDRLQ